MPFSQSSSAAASYMGRALPPAEGWMPRAALAAARKRERDFLISSYASATASSVRRRASSQ